MAISSDYIIIGNGIAGVSAAEQLRRYNKKAAIHIFSDEPYPIYSRIRLPQIISGQASSDRIILHPEQWYQEQGIQLHLSETVKSINIQQQSITSDKNTYQYARLLLASGSLSFIPPFPGKDREGVFALRTLQDAMRISEYARGKESAILIGGGVLGLEAAAALLTAGVSKVLVLEVMARLLPRQTDNTAAEILQRQLEGRGFEFYLGVKVRQILADGVELEDGRKIAGQMILVSAGIRSNIKIAQEAGIKVNQGIIVDDTLRTSVPEIFAAGDAAEHKGRVYGLWLAAQDQGTIAGINMAGGNQLYNGTVPSNRLTVVGIDLVAAGELDADGRQDSRIRQAENNYRKFVFDNGKKLIGCILLGDIKNQQLIIKAVQEKKQEREIAGLM